MRRRKFITLLGGAAATWPLAAPAQQPRMPVIGYLGLSNPEIVAGFFGRFRSGLKEAGFVEGQNVLVEYRWAYSQPEKVPELASDLVRRRVSVIVTTGGSSVPLAVKAATTTIPIVFTFGADPVKAGLVSSLNRPGGNATGVTTITTELASKRLQLLLELVPHATTIAYFSPDQGNAAPGVVEQQRDDFVDAGRSLGCEVVVFEIRSDAELDAAFRLVGERRIGAIMISPFAFFGVRLQKIATLAAFLKIPAMYDGRRYISAGGLITYGAFDEGGHQVGLYTGRILKGEKPSDLPVQQPTRFELVLNLKAAKDLGLAISPKLLVLADEVIE